MVEYIQMAHVVLPEGFPETIETVPYFLQEIDTAGWLWFFRIIILAAVIVVVWGCIYYEKHPKTKKTKPERQTEEKKGGKE